MQPTMPNSIKVVVFATWRTVGAFLFPSRTANIRRLGERGESMESFVIREASVLDVPALAQLHVTTWNATYAPMLMTTS